MGVLFKWNSVKQRFKPPPKQMDASWQFDYGYGYFDNGNGQTLFLDGIAADIKVVNDKI